MYRRPKAVHRPLPPIPARFGVRGIDQLKEDFGEMIGGALSGLRFQLGLSSVGHLRPQLSLPAYAGYVPADGLAPIMNLYDRTGGGRNYSQRVTRKRQRDFRGKRLSYDEHDGVDFVCPVGTLLCSAAPGTVVMIRDRWLRGGLTVGVDHGAGVVTQYTHCALSLKELGETVGRGEPVAVSGCSGADMTQFFPWVPPHVHFMSWVDGRPIDPFTTSDETPGPGTWSEPNTPRPSAPTPLKTQPMLSPIDSDAVKVAYDCCRDPRVRRDLRKAKEAGEPFLAAMLEDALHHDMHAWPERFRGFSVRPRAENRRDIRLSLPLPAEDYIGARFADGF